MIKLKKNQINPSLVKIFRSLLHLHQNIGRDHLLNLGLFG